MFLEGLCLREFGVCWVRAMGSFWDIEVLWVCLVLVMKG